MRTAIIAIVMFVVGSLGAAEIEWSTNKTSFVGQDGQNSVSLDGTLVEAVSLGRKEAGAKEAVKVENGGKTEEITFEQRDNVLPSSGFPTAFDLKTSDANWTAVISSADWCGHPNPTTIKLTDLKPGKRYQVEFFVYDQRDANIARRTATFDDGEGNQSETIRQDAGVSIIGTFLANDSKQTVNLTQGNAAHPTLNAYILRLLR